MLGPGPPESGTPPQGQSVRIYQLRLGCSIGLIAQSEGGEAMAEPLVLEFTAPEAVELYRKVSGILGVDTSTGVGAAGSRCRARADAIP